MVSEKENKFNILLLCISPLFIFISNNGSFTVKSIIILIVLAMIGNLNLKSKLLKLNKSQRLLLILMFEILFSTIINVVRHISVVSFEFVLDYLYFLAIYVWFYCTTSSYVSKKNVNKIINFYNLASVIMSIQVISMSLKGIQGKIMINNFVNTLMDENYVTALIAMTPVYVFVNLLNEKKGALTKIIDILIIMICSLAVALAGSRAALIGLIIGIFLTLFEYLKGKISIKKLMLFMFVILIGIIFAFNIKNVMPTWIYNRYFHSNYMDNSNTTRLLIWKNALAGIKRQPLFGFGLGVFSNLSEYKYTAGKSSPAHQTILDFGLYGGIVGIVIFICLIFSIFIPILKNKVTRKYIGVLACLTFISMILSATRSMFLWNNLIYLSLIYNSSNKIKEE